jgi:hypothetical protein
MVSDLGKTKVNPEIEDTIQRLNRIANLLDAAFPIPGTRIRIGWDSIVGLLPGVGDVITATPLFYYLSVVYQFNLGWTLAVKIILNQLIDVLVGTVPLLGDILDVVFKANIRNAKLLIDALEGKKGEV